MMVKYYVNRAAGGATAVHSVAILAPLGTVELV